MENFPVKLFYFSYTFFVSFHYHPLTGTQKERSVVCVEKREITSENAEKKEKAVCYNHH